MIMEDQQEGPTMHTLADVLGAIENLPLVAFADTEACRSVDKLVRAREKEWEQSLAYHEIVTREQSKLLRRQERDNMNAKRRAKWACKNVKAGMFIKVVGARDGKGIREVIGVEGDGIVCRQWLPHRSAYALGGVPFGAKRFDARHYYTSANQMTTHGFDKVTGYFTPDRDCVNVRVHGTTYTLHKI